MGEFSFEISTALGASAAEVWAHASSMHGVNHELGPWLRMTVPRAMRGKAFSEIAGTGEASASTLLLFGVLPFDRHRLVLERVVEVRDGRGRPGDGGGFDEESRSLLQRRWRHERRVEAGAGGGCVVTDRLTVVPRLAPVSLVAPIVRSLFESRHRRLRQRFGDPC